jgi:hypothetical protein
VDDVAGGHARSPGGQVSYRCACSYGPEGWGSSLGSGWCIRNSRVYARSNGPAHGGRAELVDVTGNQLHVAQLQRRHDRPGPLDGRLADVDANHPPGRARHLRQDGKPADRAAAAVDGMPAFPHADPAEGGPGHLPGSLGHAQQPP